MAEGSSVEQEEVLVVNSVKFGELRIPLHEVIEVPAGVLGYPESRKYALLTVDEKSPFRWLHSLDNSSLAFVVMDGFAFGQENGLKPPYNDPDCDFQEDDQYSILIVTTVRPGPCVTANLKAPLFINIRNRKGVQVVLDDPKFSVREPVLNPGATPQEEGKDPSKETP